VVNMTDEKVVSEKATSGSEGAKTDERDKDAKKKRKEKKYLLKMRWIFQDVDSDGKVIRTIKRDSDETDDDENEVPILESITIRSKATVYGSNEELSDRVYVKIVSPMIIDALRYVVKYSTESLDGNTITLRAPYRLLHNHWDLLEQFKKNHPKTHSPEYIEECNSHIDFMFNWLSESDDGKWHTIEKARWNRDPPTATFKNLWMLLKVGDILMVKQNDDITPYMLHHIWGGTVDGKKAESYTLWLWNLDFDGEFFGRSLLNEEIKQFDGEAEILSLKAYPASFHPDWDNLKKTLIER
jgi:hypothetical protein